MMDNCSLPTLTAASSWRTKIVITCFVMALFTIIGESNANTGDTPIAAAQIIPADVLVELQKLNQELQAIQRHVGAPKANALDIQVNNAAPHDVYFQALTLFQKANRLSFEITRQRLQSPTAPAGVSKLADVLALVITSHKLLDDILLEFKIVVKHQPIKRRVSTQPSDIFQEILTTNRQLNLLLQHRFDPSDVYMQVTRAMGYATLLLTPYKDATPIPELPPYEPNKNPGDVYFRLLLSLEEINKIYAIHNFSPFDIDATRIKPSNITPSDVFDLASLVVARLNYLQQQSKMGNKQPKAFFPGRKYPSDVYQRAGILLNQLQQLVRLTPTTVLPGIKTGWDQ